MRKWGIGPQDISKLYLACYFANYLDVRNAVEIGFMASVPADRIVKVGNAAIQGARELLLSRRKRQSIEQLVKRIEHVELETTPDFFERLSKHASSIRCRKAFCPRFQVVNIWRYRLRFFRSRQVRGGSRRCVGCSNPPIGFYPARNW